MIPPDQEIFEVEKRIALRRAQLKRHAGDARTRATRALASPIALLAAAGIGFLLANSFARRKKEPPHPERRKSDHAKAAKATGLAGILTTGLMWVVKAKYGSPFAAAQALLEKFSSRKTPTSARSDKRPEIRVARTTVTPLRQVRP
jgi:hypothetical protein